MASKINLSPLVTSVAVHSKVVVLLLFIPSFWGIVFGPCFVVQLCSVVSSFAIILKRKREMVTILQLSSWCLVTVSILYLFLLMPWVGLQCVSVFFMIILNYFFKVNL